MAYVDEEVDLTKIMVEKRVDFIFVSDHDAAEFCASFAVSFFFLTRKIFFPDCLTSKTIFKQNDK